MQFMSIVESSMGDVDYLREREGEVNTSNNHQLTLQKGSTNLKNRNIS
jgi:hypothetical protein